MTRRVLYVAHPLAPTGDEIAAAPASIVQGDDGGWIMCDSYERRVRAALRCNIDLAMRWLAWLRRSFPQDTFIAPWIATVLSLNGDDSAELREAGLVDDCAVVERCDGIVMTGSRIGSGGDRERRHGMSYARGWTCAAGFKVFDLTVLQYKSPPPDVDSLDMTLEEYIHEVTP